MGGQPPPPPANMYTVGDAADISRASQRPAGASTGAPLLPSVSRDVVLGTCAQTSALLAVFGLGMHQLAPLLAPAAHDGNGAALQALLECEPSARCSQRPSPAAPCLTTPSDEATCRAQLAER